MKDFDDVSVTDKEQIKTRQQKMIVLIIFFKYR